MFYSIYKYYLKMSGIKYREVVVVAAVAAVVVVVVVFVAVNSVDKL